MRKFKCKAVVMEWVNNDMIEKWDASDCIIAEDNWEAEHKFCEGIREKYEYGEKELDIDDIRIEDIGSVDVLLSVILSDYVRFGDTMTVGELIKYLKENFDEDSNIYLADYNGIVPRYGKIEIDRFAFEEDE